ncbi:Hypothetical protein, putative [Bodo saltans]|uniref:Uncharacterized protein n=1 Tax=Bodo saltans TaxID=75058 RepID=A0A0S4IRQ4_BODSA|nr:Hypothetical protein, putative [Bodo saltans]|eukprot:CUG03331.1 Hypothetical protein, putative [Bodo saltans]
MQHQFPTVKNKRPHDVARFLRSFALEDRHEATNLLLTLGLQKLTEEQQRTRASSRLVSSEPLPLDTEIVSLRSLRDVAVSARKNSRRQQTPSPIRRSSSNGRVGTTTSTEATRQRSPRCVKCFQNADVAASSSPSAAFRRTLSPKTAHRDASPDLKAMIERDKRNYYAAAHAASDHHHATTQRSGGGGVADEYPRTVLPSTTNTTHQHQQLPHHNNDIHFELIERKSLPPVKSPSAATAVTANRVADEVVAAAAAGATLASSASMELPQEAYRSISIPQYHPYHHRRDSENESLISNSAGSLLPPPSRVDTEIGREVVFPAPSTSSDAHKTVLVEAKNNNIKQRERALAEQSGAIHVPPPITSFFFPPSRVDTEIGREVVFPAPSTSSDAHKTVLVEAKNNNIKQRERALAEQSGATHVPPPKVVAPPITGESDEPPSTIPADAVRALWTYVCDQRGARRNPLVVAAALPPDVSAVAFSPEFDQVYQSLLLSYHLQEHITSTS